LISPPPSVLFTDFGESALKFRLYFSINNSFIAEGVKSDIRFKIMSNFRANKIEIPFPQQEVWVNKVENSTNG
ncbi:MAG: mechanosensitive ion channel protein MscS, partial [Flavobacteriaceae bacterium]